MPIFLGVMQGRFFVEAKRAGGSFAQERSEIGCGGAGPAGGNSFGWTRGDEFSAFRSCFWAEIEDPVGIFDNIEMVLDDKKGGALVDEAMEQSNKEGDIIEVKAGGGFIEDEKRGSVGGSVRVFVPAFFGSFFVFFLGGQMGDKFKSLSFST
jgi:hypothetical protein